MKLAAIYLYVNLSSIDLFSCILSPEGTEGGGAWTTKRLKSCSHKGVDTKSQCSFPFKSPWLFSVTKYLYIIECFWFVSETFLCDNDIDQLPPHTHTPKKVEQTWNKNFCAMLLWNSTTSAIALGILFLCLRSTLCSVCFLHFLYKHNRNWECFWHWTTWFKSESEAIFINTTAKRKHELQSIACFSLLCSRSLLKEAIPFENLAPDKNRDQEKEKKKMQR